MPADEVRVWSCRLDTLPASVDCTCLSADEHARAARWHHAINRERYIAGRAWLRHRLAQCLGVAPASIRFHTETHGKPVLAAPPMPLQFNLSHSADRALLAVTRGRRVGADIEQMRANDDIEAIARRHFAPSELDQWLLLAPERRLQGFYAGWTRKEAYVKALGGGLGTVALDGFEVSLDPDRPAALQSIGGSNDAARHWSLWSLDVAPGFAAAVVVEGTSLRLHMTDEI